MFNRNQKAKLLSCKFVSKRAHTNTNKCNWIAFFGTAIKKFPVSKIHIIGTKNTLECTLFLNRFISIYSLTDVVELVMRTKESSFKSFPELCFTIVDSIQWFRPKPSMTILCKNRSKSSMSIKNRFGWYLVLNNTYNNHYLKFRKNTNFWLIFDLKVVFWESVKTTEICQNVTKTPRSDMKTKLVFYFQKDVWGFPKSY